MSPTATARTRGATTAPVRPRHQPDPPPVRRHLRPVPTEAPTRDRAPRRRLRPQVALTMAIAVFFVILFGVALLQTVLVQGQLRLDGLRADVTARQAEAQVLRADVAAAESPARIVELAEGLGMVEPETVTHVLPPPQADTPVP